MTWLDLAWLGLTWHGLIAVQVIDIDKRNAQAAAGLARAFTTWRRFDDDRQTIVQAQLERVLAEVESGEYQGVQRKRGKESVEGPGTTFIWVDTDDAISIAFPSLVAMSHM